MQNPRLLRTYPPKDSCYVNAQLPKSIETHRAQTGSLIIVSRRATSTYSTALIVAATVNRSNTRAVACFCEDCARKRDLRSHRDYYFGPRPFPPGDMTVCSRSRVVLTTCCLRCSAVAMQCTLGAGLSTYRQLISPSIFNATRKSRN